MQSTNNQADKVRAPYLVAAVVGVHILAVGAVLFIQGCGTTTRKPTVDSPPPPTLPPHEEMVPAVMPKPALLPPASEASAMAEGGGQAYIVQKGDMLSKIAVRYGVSWKEIAELNSIKDPSKIRVGQKLLLPSYAKSAEGGAAPAQKSSAPSSKPSKSGKAGAGEYVVQSGDSLSKIASRNGTTVKALREANNLSGDMIRVGQKLVLPGGKKASEPAKAEKARESKPAPAPEPEAAPAPAPVDVPPPPVDAMDAPASEAPAVSSAPAASSGGSAEVPFEYTIRQGETLDDVARNFAVLKQDVMDLNGITDAASVQAGQKVKIPLTSP